MSGSGIDYPDLCRRVTGDELALQYFRELWAEHAPRIFDERARVNGALRVSDSGECALKLWADIHGAFDIADNLESADSRMELGTLDGAKTACKIAAGIRRWYWPLTVLIEPELDCGGIRGHADVVVYAEPETAIEVVECKLTFYSKAIEPPDAINLKGEDHKYWIYQPCRYALGVGAETFVVLVHGPAVWSGQRRKQFRYFTEDWRGATMVEYDRLAHAVGTEPPEADVREKWRCEYCRYSIAHCEHNLNPYGPVTVTIVDALEASLRDA